MKKPLAVRLFEKTERTLHLHTYQLEMALALGILIATALISQKGWIEWIGVVAVFISFGHMTLSDRLAEREAVLHKSRIRKNVHTMLNAYLVSKEILWFAYFILVGAWSALTGVILFLAYPLWRRYWKKYHHTKTSVS